MHTIAMLLCAAFEQSPEMKTSMSQAELPRSEATWLCGLEGYTCREQIHMQLLDGDEVFAGPDGPMTMHQWRLLTVATVSSCLLKHTG